MTQSCFLTRIIWDGDDHYLLWKDEGENPDHFLMNKDGGIFVGMSLTSASQFARSLGEEVDADDVSVFDFDRLWTLLRRNWTNPAFDASEYKIILDAWNLLEDMARSLRITLIPQEEDRSLIQSIYEQVFTCAKVLGTDDQNMPDDTRKEILRVTSYRSAESDCSELTSERARVAQAFLENAWGAIRGDKRWRESA